MHFYGFLVFFLSPAAAEDSAGPRGQCHIDSALPPISAEITMVDSEFRGVESVFHSAPIDHHLLP